MIRTSTRYASTHTFDTYIGNVRITTFQRVCVCVWESFWIHALWWQVTCVFDVFLMLCFVFHSLPCTFLQGMCDYIRKLLGSGSTFSRPWCQSISLVFFDWRTLPAGDMVIVGGTINGMIFICLVSCLPAQLTAQGQSWCGCGRGLWWTACRGVARRPEGIRLQTV